MSEHRCTNCGFDYSDYLLKYRFIESCPKCGIYINVKLDDKKDESVDDKLELKRLLD